MLLSSSQQKSNANVKGVVFGCSAWAGGSSVRSPRLLMDCCSRIDVLCSFQSVTSHGAPSPHRLQMCECNWYKSFRGGKYGQHEACHAKAVGFQEAGSLLPGVFTE